ncbi:MAG: amidohydrolase family protein [Acidobacteria bacterium]|nr:amidohydrolase family protein [Acidobacteriota bacterium]
MSRTLLHGGVIVDGSGNPPYAGDLLIEGDRIAAVGRFGPAADALRVDCTGLVVSPGFIDSHSHSDLQVLENRPEKTRQGVTTEVVGNCGFSPYPMPRDRSLLHEFANGIFCGDQHWGWDSARSYLDDVNRRSEGVAVVSLIGHGSLRMAQAGTRLGALPAPDVAAMERALAEAFDQGAAGFSTGLMYSPGESAPFEELQRLCRVAARHGKIYTTHIRSYTFALVEAVEEQLELAKRSGCRLQISHLQAVGPANWPKQQQAIEKIERARESGVDVGFDCYPYVAGSTVLTQLLPQWVLEGGVEGMLARFADRGMRARIAAETTAATAQDWTDLYISAVGSAANRGLVGRNLAEIAELRGREPVEVVMDILAEERGVANMLEFNQSEDNLRQLLTHPLAAIMSDGFYVTGQPHPRLYGTFPHLLGEICRTRRWLSLAEAVRKITSVPAERFHLWRRGLLKVGFFADVTAFDSESIGSNATYENPKVAPRGVRSVFRMGRPLGGQWI